MKTKRNAAKLPADRTLLKRDMHEVYEMHRTNYVRCLCGHLKQSGYICDHCGEDSGAKHPVSPEPMEVV